MNGYMRAYFAIFLSFIIALCLSMLPMPHMLYWLRPSWVTLFLIYWVAFIPNKIGVFSGLALGIGVDLLRGNFIGSMGLTLSIVAYITTVLRLRLRQVNLWVQLVVVAFLVVVEQLLSLWVQLLFSDAALSYSYLLTTIISVAVWPLLHLLLQSYQRNLKIH